MPVENSGYCFGWWRR